MPGCGPSSRRTAVPRWRGLLSRSCSWAPPSPCDEGFGEPAVVPWFLVQGLEGASPPRFELRHWLPVGRTERGMVRPRVHKHGCGHAPGTLWPGTQVSQARLRTPATACSTWTSHVLVLAVAVRCPCEPVGLQCFWVQGTLTPP
jgi:hypothetical protein